VARVILHAAALAMVFAGTAKARPAPTLGPDEVAAEIVRRASYHGADAATMLRVATCESRLDPNAVNPSSGATGVFQWLPPANAWAATPHSRQVNIWALYRQGDPDAVFWDIDGAAWAFAHNMQSHWACK
jgi:hypothetical protein